MTIARDLGMPETYQDYVGGNFTQQWVDKLIKEGRIQNRAELSFIWREEHCDPLNWHYEESTYEVNGAHLSGKPCMMFWSETESSKVNLGRATFSVGSKVQELVNEIQSKGIQPREGSFVYWDVDTGKTINGDHRRRLSSILNIPGWMMQGVKFDSNVARIRFAARSNARSKGLLHNNTSKQDVTEAVRNVLAELSLTQPIVKKDIVKEVKELGFHLSEATRDDIRDQLFVEIQSDGSYESGEHYIMHNNATIERLLGINAEGEDAQEDSSGDDPWVTNYSKNDEEITLVVNVKNFQQRVGSILSAHAKAKKQNKPLHLLFTVPIVDQCGKESLLTKREKFFSTHLQALEDQVLIVMKDVPFIKLDDEARKFFAWNHPEAQHRAMPQDTVKEDQKTLINVRNRTFN